MIIRENRSFMRVISIDKEISDRKKTLIFVVTILRQKR